MGYSSEDRRRMRQAYMPGASLGGPPRMGSQQYLNARMERRKAAKQGQDVYQALLEEQINSGILVLKDGPDGLPVWPGYREEMALCDKANQAIALQKLEEQMNQQSPVQPVDEGREET